MSFRHLMEKNFSNSTTETQVSLEGFGDLVSKVKSIFAKPAKGKPGEMLGEQQYTPEAKKAKAELLAAIRNQYANRKWLEKQTFATGSINAKDFSKIFEIDGKVGNDPLGNVEAALKRMETFYNRYNSDLKAYDQRLEQIDQKTAREVVAMDKKGCEDDEIDDRMDIALNEMANIRDPLNSLPPFTGTSLGNMVPFVKRHGKVSVLMSAPKTAPKGVDSLPALTIDQIQKAATMLAELLEGGLAPKHYVLSGLDHSDGSEFNEIIYDRSFGKFEDYYDEYYFQTLWDKYHTACWNLIDDWALARGLERLINRSIQG